MDTETEERILAELKRSRSGRTTLIVSHRVSTARHADRILILDAGQIVEGGSHRELIEQDGFYAELERLQRGGEPVGKGGSGLGNRSVPMTAASVKRDYSMFDADLSGKALNLSLLRRLLSGLSPTASRSRSAGRWC